MKHRLSRITTRTGDGGTTALADGVRIPKGDARIALLAALDELNARVGSLRAAIAADHALQETLEPMQHRIFDLGAVVACEDAGRFPAEGIETLEVAVEHLNAQLPPLREFVLPGGSEASSRAHLARTACRSAEQSWWQAYPANGDSEPPMGPPAAWLNRAGDLLFIVARTLAREDGEEAQWESSRSD